MFGMLDEVLGAVMYQINSITISQSFIGIIVNATVA
jgi:hypothetical protein